MNTRWTNAQNDGNIKFYSFDANPLYVSSDSTYTPAVSFKYASVYNRDPRIGFFVKDNDLVVWGRTESGISDIDFDVAVIRNSGLDAGKGWLTTIITKSYDVPLTRSTISISSLTSNKHANEAALGNDYNIYIIVTKTSRMTGSNSGNDSIIINSFSDRNVILAYPTPYMP